MSELKTTPEACGMGHSMKRKEDARFLRGQGKYTDDVVLPGMLHMDIVRSPYAYAKIKSIMLTQTLSTYKILEPLRVFSQIYETYFINYIVKTRSFVI